MNENQIIEEVDKLYTYLLGLAQKAKGEDPDRSLKLVRVSRVLGRAVLDMKKVINSEP